MWSILVDCPPSGERNESPAADLTAVVVRAWRIGPPIVTGDNASAAGLLQGMAQRRLPNYPGFLQLPYAAEVVVLS